LVLAAVLLISGVIKALDARETIVAVRAYQLVPESLVGAVAAVLPYLEIALGLLLLIGLATRLAAVLAAVVMVVFVAAVTSAAARGLSIDCGAGVHDREATTVARVALASATYIAGTGFSCKLFRRR